MSRSGARCCSAVGVVVALVVGAMLPAQAEYTKLYKCWNTTGENRYRIRAVTMALEVITQQSAEPSDWGPPYTTTEFGTWSGVPCTVMVYGVGAGKVLHGDYIKVGWTTADGSCQLRDLRWVQGDGTKLESVVPTSLGGVPGGGELYQDPAGNWIWRITNDTDLPITLSHTDLGVFASELDLSDLDYIVEHGMVSIRVAAIKSDIEALIAEVQAAGDAGVIPSPSAGSLIRKLTKALQYTDQGLASWEIGDADGALVAWARAAKQVASFISEVTNQSDRGNVPPPLDEQWIAKAADIQARLENLPGTGASPVEGVVLPPGEFIEFPVAGVQTGNGLVLQGSVFDPVTGEKAVDWLEQATAETIEDTIPPEITATISPGNLWPPNHEMVPMALNVTVTDNSGAAAWGVWNVSSNEPVEGTGDGDAAPDWWFGTDPYPGQLAPDVPPDYDPPAPPLLWLRAERSGNDPTGMATRAYTVTLIAVDAAGNQATTDLVVKVTHDEGSSTASIVSLAAAPTGAGGVQIVANLAAAGQVDAEVLNIAGRRVRTIVAGRQCEQGITTLLWDGRSDRGLSVPAGVYLIRVTVRSADGQQAGAMAPVSIRP